MSTNDPAARAAALLEDAGVDPEDERAKPDYCPQIVRVCWACGWRGQAKYCARCSSSTVVEGIE